MKSSRFEYQLVTAPHGRFAYQYRPIGSLEWLASFGDYETKVEANDAMYRSAAKDDFIAEVVEL